MTLRSSVAAWACAITVSALLIAKTSAALPPNDECSSPAPISGPGGWNVDDLIPATLSTTPPPIPGTSRDLWYCWTPTWTGVAQLDLHAASQLSAQVFLGCGCPAGGPLLTLSAVQGLPVGPFQVACNQQYLIRIAAESYPWPPVDPIRAFTISKVGGKDCPPVANGNCADCCGAKPTYDDPLYSSSFTGQVAVATQSYVGIFGGPGGQIITIFNLASTPAAIPGSVWDPVPGPPATSFRYSKPSWNVNNLGSVFALTLDNSGNIYTAYCAATNAPTGSVIVGSTSGTIFKIPTGTGAPQVFCNIPDNLAPPVTCNGNLIPCGSPNICPPGIGDVCCDCAHGGQFFASAFADGRIYRISAAGAVLEAFDHDTNTVGPPIREPGNAYDRYVPLGERVWAVKAHNGRLYYSIWGQEFACDINQLTPGSSPNRIFSIALSGTGAFIPNSRRMELQVPVYPPSTASSGPFNPQASAPVSDIAFSPTCKMMLAERAVGENGVVVLAHDTRALEFAWNGSAWVPSNYRNGLGYPVGATPVGLPNTNACGGTDYDFATGSNAIDGRAWFTGDVLTPYGLTAVDTTSPAYATAIAIDYNGGAGGGKSKMCDVEIPCPTVVHPCATFSNEQVLCNFGANGTFSYTFQITNNTGVPVQYLLFPGSNFPNHIVTLPSPLPPGGTSAPITIQITGLVTGQVFCFDVTLADEQVQECCRQNHCITAPPCNCMQLPLIRTACIPGQPNSFTLTFTVQNLGPSTVNELYIFPPIGSPVLINPNYFPLPPLASGQTSAPMTTTISGVAPGQQICLRFSIHHDGEECCSEVICITAPASCPGHPMPEPCTPGTLCWADCDGSGALNVLDFACFLNHYAAQDPCANCDLSTTAPVLNVIDFGCFLTPFAAGCP